jgi:hypothetical protein
MRPLLLNTHQFVSKTQEGTGLENLLAAAIPLFNDLEHTFQTHGEQITDQMRGHTHQCDTMPRHTARQIVTLSGFAPQLFCTLTTPIPHNDPQLFAPKPPLNSENLCSTRKGQDVVSLYKTL